jgi:NTE family protein
LTEHRPPRRPASYGKRIALALQGGGALGSYQGGVYEALAASGYIPDWIAGISIGAINAALIAGNSPDGRLDALRGFWDEVTAPTAFWPSGLSGPLAVGVQGASALSALLFGAPGLFGPPGPKDWLSCRTPTSYYQTQALKSTLERRVDFDRINTAGEIRLSVGAVNVQTGRFAFFDSTETKIRPEHVMASAALPPGFPAVEIDGELYWDGGLVSNTPLQYIIDTFPRRSHLCFQVDLFQGFGELPKNLDEVGEREKDIRYSSRTRVITDALIAQHEVRHAINELHKRLPPELAATKEAKRLYELGCVTEMDIVQLIYRPFSPQGAWKDFEFSRATMNARWEQGMLDTLTTLHAAPWLAPTPKEIGVRVFDVMHDVIVAQEQAKAGA